MGQQFGGITDITSAVDKAKAELALLTAQGVAATEENARRRGELNAEYDRLKSVYDRLKHEVSLLEENLEDRSLGKAAVEAYRMRHDFSRPTPTCVGVAQRNDVHVSGAPHILVTAETRERTSSAVAAAEL